MIHKSDTERLRDLSVTAIDEVIPSDVLAPVLAAPPFIPLPGSLNLRDVGAFAAQFVKPGLVFRSGTLDFVPDEARPLLRSQLRLSNIYDLRRRDEIKTPLPDVEGIQLLSCPYMDGTEMPPVTVVADFAPKEDGKMGVGYTDMYETVLKGYKTGFEAVLRGLLTVPDGDAILFHCTAGRDRTGVMAALILDLVGAPPELIAADYALSRIGVEPFREKLVVAMLQSIPGPHGTGDAPSQGKPKGMNAPGMRELMSTDPATMEAFVAHLRAVYGGAEGYIRDQLGFSDAEIHALKGRIAP